MRCIFGMVISVGFPEEHSLPTGVILLTTLTCYFESCISNIDISVVKGNQFTYSQPPA